MKATVLDLRYKMKEVMKALEKREKVTVLYHGKVKGTIVPAGADRAMKVRDHPFFGMIRDEVKPVAQRLDELRGSRFDDI
jgi:hypothetical protein